MRTMYGTVKRVITQIRGATCLFFLLFSSILSDIFVHAATSNVVLSIPISPGTVSISAPASLAFSAIATSFLSQTVTQDFTGTTNYFIITDLKGVDSGYNTTLQIAGDLVTGGNRISSGNLSFKADLAVANLLSGTANPRVITDSAATGGYQSLNNSRTFMYRNLALNTGVISQYAQTISMQLIVPAGQPPGAYSGAIVYTVIEN